MSTSKFFALGAIFLTLLLPAITTHGVASQSSAQYSNYVVIGAFAIQKNAVNFTADAVKNNYSAKFEINGNRKLFYVYVLITGNREQAIQEALRLRKESPYFDTWVYNGLLGEGGENIKGTDINPVTTQQIEKVEETQSDRSVNNEVVGVTEDESKKDSVAAAEQNAEVIEDEGTETAGKKFLFRIYRADNAEQVEGDVNVIDVQRSRKIGTYQGNKPIRISAPSSKDGNSMVSLVCEIFGYRKVQYDVNYNSPEGPGIENTTENGTVVPFELMRLQKGDYAIMYNVYFFKDAAIMRPESRYEVNSLLTMLQENPKYKIRIHGHTNGNAHGKIISLDKDATNFFALNNTKDGVGSAKKLSQERAEVIRNFLVTNGIDITRMQVKAWGGKRPIYDKHSPQAQSNVRVEIEILEH